MTPELEIREVSIVSDDAQMLIRLLDRELSSEYAPADRHAVELASFHSGGGVFAIAYDAGAPIACGALRPIDSAEVELKRMYVVESHRGRGASRCMLEYLEDRARELGFRRLLLETGDRQAAAIALYSKSGYQRIDAFGEYIGGGRSVCFGKELSSVEPPELVSAPHSVDDQVEDPPTAQHAAAVDLVTIATYGDPQEASLASAALEEGGVSSYVIGAETGSMLWHVGTALGGVRLQVAANDAERAGEILRDRRTDDGSTVAAWSCPSCGADVDEGFEVCWSCGHEYDPAADAREAANESERTNNEQPALQPEVDAPDPLEGERLAGRAWRAAVIGIGFFPLGIYAAFLVVEALQLDLSPAARRKIRYTMVVIGLTLPLYAMLLFMILP